MFHSRIFEQWICMLMSTLFLWAIILLDHFKPFIIFDKVILHLTNFFSPISFYFWVPFHHFLTFSLNFLFFSFFTWPPKTNLLYFFVASLIIHRIQFFNFILHLSLTIGWFIDILKAICQHFYLFFFSLWLINYFIFYYRFIMLLFYFFKLLLFYLFKVLLFYLSFTLLVKLEFSCYFQAVFQYYQNHMLIQFVFSLIIDPLLNVKPLIIHFCLICQKIIWMSMA